MPSLDCLNLCVFFFLEAHSGNSLYCKHLEKTTKKRAPIQRYTMAALVTPLSSHHRLYVVKHETGAIFFQRQND